MKGTLLAIVGVAVPLVLMLTLVYIGGGRADAPAVCPRDCEEALPEPPIQKGLAKPERVPVEPGATREAEVMTAVDAWLAGLRVRVQGDAGYKTVQAAALLAARRFDAAIRAFDRLMVDSPGDPEVLLGKGLALTGAGRYDDAAPLFDRLIELGSRDADMLFNVATAQMRSGDFDAAMGTCHAVLELNGDHLKAKYNLAVIHQSQERYSAGITLWRELTADGATFERQDDALFHRGECALMLQLYPEAAECFERVVRANDEDAKAWCNLGIACAAREQHDEAIAALGKALTLDDGLIPAMNQLAYVYVTKYRDSQAIEDRDAVVRYTTMSLRTFASQPHIEALREAVERIDLAAESETAETP